MTQRKPRKSDARKNETPSDRPADNAGISVRVAATIPEGRRDKITSLTQTNRQLKRKIFDLYTIFEISRNFNAVLDYEQLLDTFILTSLAQVGASKAALFLEEGKKSENFVLAQSKGVTDLQISDFRFGGGSSFINRITKLSCPELTSELLESVADPEEQKVMKYFNPGLVVPLMYQTKLTGIFLIADKMSGRPFGLDDNEFLSILGSQISVAIENARLYNSERTASRQLRAAQEQLIRSERLTALGEMSAKVAHEINNPLGIIKNYLLLTKRSLIDNEEALEYTDFVAHEIDRIAQIVSELLDFHRPSGFVFREINIVSVLEDVLKLMEHKLAGQKIKLARNYEKDVLPVEASPENLKQVFINIIINACDAMPGGGCLAVSASQVDGNVRLSFCDTGPGIEPDVVQRIFEPFYTTKEPGKGTGLGLSVCYGIIKKHKGSINYKSIKSGGCFEISIPGATDQKI